MTLMRLIFALLAVIFAVSGAPSAKAQYQAVIPLCGEPPAPCTNANPLPVSPTSGGGTSNVNVVQFGSNNVVTGTGIGGSGIPRVTVSSDSTVGLVAGTSIIGKVGIDQTTPGTTNGVQVNAALPAGANVIGHVISDTGSTTAVTQATAANLNATVVGTGTFATQSTLQAGSAVAGKFGVDQTTPGTTNGVSIVGVNAATALAGNGATGAGSARVTIANDNTGIANWGQGATGATAPTGAVLNGGRGQNAEATAVTNGQMVALAADLVGKLITSPYANKENWIAGTGNATGTGATTIIASAGGSLKNYITSVQCGRTDTGTTAIIVTFNDSASTVITLPNGGNGGATNISFPTPLATAAATAFQFTAGTGVTTLYCSAQGFKGT